MTGLVSIIILACNQLEYTKQCVASIIQHTNLPYQLILVDNGSQDQTLEYFQSIPSALVIHNQKNLGYAKGNNQGIRQAAGDYLLFLNNDTIVAPHWLEQMLACLNSRPEYGAVGPRTNFAAVTGMPELAFNSDDDIQRFATYFNHHNQAKWFEVDWLPGFCLLTKSSVIRAVGSFDENFKLGLCEDVDLGRRIKQQGYKNICAGDTFIFHYGSRTLRGLSLNIEKILTINNKYLARKWER